MISIEPFTTDYIPTAQRDLTTDEPKNLNRLITEPKADYVRNLRDYNDYLSYQTYLRDKNWTVGSSPNEQPSNVKNDINWKIHRWSIWDYIKDWKPKYFCKAQQFNGTTQCVPLNNKGDCSVNNLYTDAYKCLKSIKKPLHICPK